jgi:methylated-DNA-[protein]-cysteine S-methyltransferase
MTVEATTLSTPAGDLTLLARDGILIAAGFADLATMAARIDDEEVVLQKSLGPLSDAMTAYVAGDVHAIDDLPVEQPGGEFFQACWKVMREVPAGETITYAELAERAGRPKAVRAAGSACARNLIAPIVPCHRVRRTGEALGGYYYGLTTKQWLLEHESEAASRHLA